MKKNRTLTRGPSRFLRLFGSLIVLISACAGLSFGEVASDQDLPTVPEFAPDQPSVTAQSAAVKAATTPTATSSAKQSDDDDDSDEDSEAQRRRKDPPPPGDLPGISFSGWIPPDPIIAAGPASLVAMVNQRIAIFDKKGTKFFEQDLAGSSGFWGAQGASSSVGDPWVIFDPNSGRFMALAADFGAGIGFLYLAISKTSTPINSGDWHKYRVDRSGTHTAFPGEPTFPDYPKLGVDGDAAYVTANHFAKNSAVTTLFSHAEIFAIDKAPLLSGGPLNIVYSDPVITDTRFFSIHPAIVFEPEPAMYFVHAIARRPEQEIVVHALANVLTAPVRTVSAVPVAPFDRPPNVPQLGGGVPLDSVDARIMSGVVRNGSFWTSHAIVDPAVDLEAVVRWYQFDITGLPGAPATLVQSGNVDPGPDIHTWIPHINVDAAGNMGISFSVGGPNQYAAIGYTGRLASDSPGTTRPVQTARAGEGYYERTGGGTRNRWGDYSGLAIDPDGCTFWLFNEYPTAANEWQTFMGAFQVDPCLTIQIAADGFESGNFSGGTGNWTAPWSASGDVSILTSSGPAVGTRHVRLRSSTGLLERSVNVAGAASLQLSFWAKVNSFEGSDRADVLVSTDGVNFVTAWSFTSAFSDSLYHYYPIDLTSLLPASQIYIAFDAGMNANNDNWYLDDISLTGTFGNIPPVANAGPDQTVADTSNDGVETVTLNGSASSDADGTIVGYEWKEGATVLGTTAVISPSLSVGSHTLTLNVTDNAGATDSDTVIIQVNNAAPAEMHAGDLDGTPTTQGTKWKATIVVTIHDATHQLVPGATVTGSWSGGFTGSASATTEASGQCSFVTGLIPKNSGSVTFTVTGAQHSSLTYNASENHDPEADSNGTSISVTKP